jgi:hypothetical protein
MSASVYYHACARMFALVSIKIAANYNQLKSQKENGHIIII